MYGRAAAWTRALQGDLDLVFLREVGSKGLLLLLVVVGHARQSGGADGKEDMGGLLVLDLVLDLVLGRAVGRGVRRSGIG